MLHIYRVGLEKALNVTHGNYDFTCSRARSVLVNLKGIWPTKSFSVGTVRKSQTTASGMEVYGCHVPTMRGACAKEDLSVYI